MTGSEEGRIRGKGALLMCDRVRRGKDSREEGLLVCDRVRRGKDSREEACWCVTGSEEGRIVGRRPVGV